MNVTTLFSFAYAMRDYKQKTRLSDESDISKMVARLLVMIVVESLRFRNDREFSFIFVKFGQWLMPRALFDPMPNVCRFERWMGNSNIVQS